MTKSSVDKVFACINAKAGTCKPEVVEKAIEAALGDRLIGMVQLGPDLDIEKELGSSPARDANVVIVAGGDGSILAVARELVGSARKLAILPCGTANNLAKHLAIPLELEKALTVVADHEIKNLDAMRAGGQVYFSHLSAGVYANAAHQTDPAVKAVFGRLAHAWQVLRGIFRRHHWKFRLKIDDSAVHIKASTLMVANVGSVGGGGFEWGEDIRADDGVLNVCAIHARRPIDYLKLVWGFLRLHRPPRPHASFWKAKSSITMAANHRLALRGDGEDAGCLPVEVTIEKETLKVLVPR